jgi:hypothetical protein
MSYTYLQELGEESSAESFLDIPQFVLSRLNLTAEKSYSKDNEMESCQNSQSGTMCKHSTENHGKEKLTSSAEDSPAKTFQLLEKELELKENDLECGDKWQGSLARYDLNSCSWKTRQCLLFEDSEELLETWPQWGLTQGMEFWEATPPMGAQMGNVSGFSLMRPTASDGLRHKFKLHQLIRKNHSDGNLSEQLARVHKVKLTPLASEILMGWPETWTDLNPLEMDNVQDWLHLHGKY